MTPEEFKTVREIWERARARVAACKNGNASGKAAIETTATPVADSSGPNRR